MRLLGFLKKRPRSRVARIPVPDDGVLVDGFRPLYPGRVWDSATAPPEEVAAMEAVTGLGAMAERIRMGGNLSPVREGTLDQAGEVMVAAMNAWSTVPDGWEMEFNGRQVVLICESCGWRSGWFAPADAEAATARCDDHECEL